MEDIIPAVIVFASDKGLPTATTHSPGFAFDDDPSFSVGRSFYE